MFVNSTETDDARPFFLYLAPTAPHFNIGPPVRYQPNPFADAPLPTHANYDEADVSDKPTWLRDGVPPDWGGRYPDRHRQHAERPRIAPRGGRHGRPPRHAAEAER